MTDFNWVEYLLPYLLGALGWLTLTGAFLWWLIWAVRNDDKKTQAAEELGKRLDRTSSGTRVHWFLDDPTEDEPPARHQLCHFCDGSLAEWECQLLRDQPDPPAVPRYYDSGWKP